MENLIKESPHYLGTIPRSDHTIALYDLAISLDPSTIQYIDVGSLIAVQSLQTTMSHIAQFLYLIGASRCDVIGKILDPSIAESASKEYERLAIKALDGGYDNIRHIKFDIQTPRIVEHYIILAGPEVSIEFIHPKFRRILEGFILREFEDTTEECLITREAIHGEYYKCPQNPAHVYSRTAFDEWVRISKKYTCIACTNVNINVLDVRIASRDTD